MDCSNDNLHFCWLVRLSPLTPGAPKVADLLQQCSTLQEVQAAEKKYQIWEI
jgi:hypothetical protein